MIRKLVFDMGNVLVYYDSRRASRAFAADEAEMELVNTAVFISPEWIMLDMGVISDEEALRRIQARLPQGHAREAARLCMEHWHEYCMWPVPGMEELTASLKEQGWKLYLCSNAAIRLVDCYRDVIPGIGLFDGILFSAEVKCMKPQKEMYRHLFERFHLKPEECFFIDDQPLNIQGARECGMDEIGRASCRERVYEQV